MSPSLSVILPVHNAQERLVDQVATLLEIVPDLTPAFDITIVDDGSTDHTPEIAQGLARYYPQVRLLRHSMRHGHAASVETGLRNTTGEIVFVQDDRASISPSQLRRMWRMRTDQRLVMATSQTGASEETAGMVQRLVQWAATLNSKTKAPSPHGGTQMIRRSTAEQLGSLADPTNHLAVHRSVHADQKEQENVAGEGPNFLLRLKEIVTHR